ncbi:MAG: hypothetical protein BRC58_03230 [Cyanobacteria bacterium QS_8_64_29]|nr:MAG: hypothetical protein BRC58_03230 [Cyanobacteria bacterium QS_8_64_29]
MSESTELLRYRDVRDRLVLDRDTTETLGRLTRLGIDPQKHQIESLTCRSGWLGRRRQTFAWSQLAGMGEDGLQIDRSPDKAAERSPEQLYGLIGSELWTDAGDRIGWLTDYWFRPQTGAIARYLYAARSSRDHYLLDPVGVSSAGNQRVIVLTSAIERATPWQEEAPGGLARLSRFWQRARTRPQQETASEGNSPTPTSPADLS